MRCDLGWILLEISSDAKFLEERKRSRVVEGTQTGRQQAGDTQLALLPWRAAVHSWDSHFALVLGVSIAHEICSTRA